MSLADELIKRFRGRWMVGVLFVGLFVCGRFAGAAWHTQGLDVKLLRSLWLYLSCFGLGLVFAICLLIARRIGKTGYSKPPVVADIAWGLKYGFVVGVLLVFVAGVLLVDDYLKPILDLWNSTVGRLIDKALG
jgi:hypothetical protein